ncbi:uncharacterized protein LOC101221597 isoform X1 [Cucumis sativus]|uniref:uncharacterized protein LOC101221597 isoform X1 n=1 Tax=Cucumis sativus TaxID=3659 RepID=UPI0002B4C0C7|nr:uncharacterized protein LOC101221597 isoform X1 [Cucumis sativus]KAE8653359.1 hypothetical protein Csa_007536 [Cucumis sativus]
MCPNTMAPTNTTAPSEENKKKRSASASASSGEAQVQGDAKRSCHGSSSFPIDHSGFGSSVDNLIVGEGVNGFVEKWKEFEPAYRQKVFKDMNTMAQSILSPITMKDGAIHNLSFFQGISQNAMEIVGDFFEDYYRQMGHTYMKKEASKEHKSTTRRKIGEDENYNTGGSGEEET